MAFRWRVDVGPSLKTGLVVSLRFFRGPDPAILVRNPIFCDFLAGGGGGGVRTPCPSFGSAHERCGIRAANPFGVNCSTNCFSPTTS